MKQFMGVRFEEVLDPKTKELVLLAASAVAGCGPWTQSHFAGAKSKGASTDELQQTIALAMMARAAGVKNFVKGVVPEFSAENARVW